MSASVSDADRIDGIYEHPCGLREGGVRGNEYFSPFTKAKAVVSVTALPGGEFFAADAERFVDSILRTDRDGLECRSPGPLPSLTEPDPLRQQLRDHFAPHISQAELAALELEGQPGVIQAEQMQQGRVDVMDLDAVAGRGEAELVGSAD